MAARVEKRSCTVSQSVFFERVGGHFCPVEGAPIFALEDPFVVILQGTILLGGVEVNQATKVYNTKFFLGPSLSHLEPLLVGPPGMKDIRIVEEKGGVLGVFTRPQGEIGGRGKIGFCEVPALSHLDAGTIMRAPLIEDQFGPLRWGRVNQAIFLENDTIGVVGHLAYFDNDMSGQRHYEAITFEFDPKTNQSTKMKTLATRGDFPPAQSKRPDLTDVIFASGLTHRSNNTVELMVGLGDAAVGVTTVGWPFRCRRGESNP